MPEQIQVTLFTFDELSEESQQRIIEPFREAHDPDYSIAYDEFNGRDFGLKATELRLLVNSILKCFYRRSKKN